MNLKRIIAATSAALLLSVSLPAAALDLGVGGVNVSTGNGGASVTTGSTSAGVTLGGGSSVASASVGAGGTGGSVGIGAGSGPLVATSTDGQTTSGNVNLGNLLGIISGPGGGGGGGGIGGPLPGVVPPDQIEVAYTSMSSGDQQRLQIRCQSVLLNADGFDRSLVDLCRIIWKLQMPGG